MKRFTETSKWSDPWFMDLPGKWKLLWLYLLDSCDNAGVWQPNIRLASVQIGEPFEAAEAMRIFAGRVEMLPSGKWHVSKFVSYQYGELSEACRPHKQVLELRIAHGLDRVSKGYPYPSNRVQDKDKDQDKDQDKDREPKKRRATMAEVTAFAEELGLPASDGEASFYRWEASGWTTSGKPIKDWKAQMRQWKAAGYHPSQKGQIPPPPPKPKAQPIPAPDNWQARWLAHPDEPGLDRSKPWSAYTPQEQARMAAKIAEVPNTPRSDA